MKCFLSANASNMSVRLIPSKDTLVACWLSCTVLLCCSPHRDTGQPEHTPESPQNSNNSFISCAIRFTDITLQSYSDLIDHFDQVLKNENGKKEIIRLTREIAVLADRNKLNHDGFSLEFSNHDGAMQVCMRGNPSEKVGY